MISIIKTTYQNQGFESQETVNRHDNLSEKQSDDLIEKAFLENDFNCIVPLSVSDIRNGIFLVVQADADFSSIWQLKIT